MLTANGPEHCLKDPSRNVYTSKSDHKFIAYSSVAAKASCGHSETPVLPENLNTIEAKNCEYKVGRLFIMKRGHIGPSIVVLTVG